MPPKKRVSIAEKPVDPPEKKQLFEDDVKKTDENENENEKKKEKENENENEEKSELEFAWDTKVNREAALIYAAIFLFIFAGMMLFLYSH